MAKIALRVYNHEIENLIENGQVDECIAHCQHILKTFPMHVETYRLLGKAYLEAHRYGDAADIFLRLLQAVPDDFVTHVGMSIIRDDENKLDEAIWHMERAFEVQPSNPAIQSELRRLYGRRDGVEPPKIRLSRDALANMYAQGELYSQAISEIRAVLAEDANRPDLQVMLARAYFNAGQKVEAAEMAIQLLKKYPHCMDALRILLDVLPGTTRADDTQTYRQRLCLLDPYASFVTGSVFQSDTVADAVVNLERLEYTPPSVVVKQGGTKTILSGGGKAPTVNNEQIPEWIGMSAGAVASSEPVPATAESESAVPEWLREAGWQEATGAVPEGSIESGAGDEASPVEPIEKANIPEWLKSMAPAKDEESQPAVEEASSLTKGELPDWMKEINDELKQGSSDSTNAVGESADSKADGSYPEWLKKPGVETPVGPVISDQAEALLVTAALAEPVNPDEAEALPLAGTDVESVNPDQAEALPVTEAQGEPVNPDEGEALPVTAALAESVNPDEGEALPVTEAQVEPVNQDQAEALPVADTKVESVNPDQAEAHPVMDAPDWLRAVAPDSLAASSLDADSASERIPAADDLPHWLKDIPRKDTEKDASEPAFQAESPAIQGDIETPGVATPGEIPEWLESLKGDPDHGTDLTEDQEVKPVTGAQRLSIDDDAMGWLESLAAKQGANPDELLTRPEDRPVDAPASVTGLGIVTAAIVDATTGPSMQAVTEPEPTPTGTIETDEGLPTDGGMHAEVEAVPVPESIATTGIDESAAALPAQNDDTLAVWLKNLDTEMANAEIPPASRTEAETPATDDLPDWLKAMDRPQPVNEQDMAAFPQEKESLNTENEPVLWEPDDSTSVVEPAAPTVPEEWIPADTAGEPVPTEEVHPADMQDVEKTGPAVITEKEKEESLLGQAQTALKQSQLNEAIQIYIKLIKKGKLLDEVIHDLREANYRFPVDIIVWQTLGDAYMRANRLQEALDAYTEAEKLLR